MFWKKEIVYVGTCKTKLCDKNGTANCGYKSQPLSARQTKKSPWQYRLEVFQGILPRITPVRDKILFIKSW